MTQRNMAPVTIDMGLAVTATPDPVDYINLLKPRGTAPLTVDFTWSPLGAVYVYPNGRSSGSYKAQANTLLTFTAKVVNPLGTSDVKPVVYEWDFGDGVRAFGPTVTHTFKIANESVRVSLCVTDSLGSRQCVGHQIILDTVTGSTFNKALSVVSTLASALKRMVGKRFATSTTMNVSLATQVTPGAGARMTSTSLLTSTTLTTR